MTDTYGYQRVETPNSVHNRLLYGALTAFLLLNKSGLYLREPTVITTAAINGAFRAAATLSLDLNVDRPASKGHFETNTRIVVDMEIRKLSRWNVRLFGSLSFGNDSVHFDGLNIRQARDVFEGDTIKSEPMTYYTLPDVSRLAYMPPRDTT